MDDTSFTDVTDKRMRWILARIVASKLGTPGMNVLISNNEPQVKIAVAKALGKMMVKNESIIDALDQLSRDDDEHVRKIATEALPRVRRCPMWPGFP